MEMDRFRHQKVLVVGIGKTGFSLINFFNRLDCEIKVTDIRPIFELNKAVKRLKKLKPVPEMAFGEHRDEDFLEADVVVFGPSVNPYLPQLELARMHGKEVYSQFELACSLCTVPLVLICGSFGRSTVAHMIGHALKAENKNIFIGGGTENPFINLWLQEQENTADYAVIEASVQELQQFNNVKPAMTIFTNISDQYDEKRFKSYSEYMDVQLGLINKLPAESFLIVNYDKLSNNAFFRTAPCKVCWYTRKSFAHLGILGQVQGTHFHQKRIHSGIHYHSEFIVSNMRIVGENNRENLLAAITACKALSISDNSIQTLIEKFPGIPHRLEFVMEKNGVSFYNDSKSENMADMVESLAAYKSPVILIAGGKDSEENYEAFFEPIKQYVRVLVLVGECKERLNRILGDATQTYLVGSFEESILIAYQKSRTGDIILLSPGNKSTDIFRDYEERGNYFKKLVYQL